MAPLSDDERALRREVRLLGRLLGEVIAEHEGPALLEREERIRLLAIERRRGARERRKAADEELERELSALASDEVEPIIRAFATYFQLVNLAEQQQRIRRMRSHERSGGAFQRGSLASMFQQARANGVTAARLREALAQLEVTLVFTAHPTQAARRTVLEKLYRIARLADERDRCRLTVREQEAATEAMREEIAALWQTDELRHERPSVGDEVKNVLWYVEQTLRPLVAALPERLRWAFEKIYGEPLGEVTTPLRLRSWVGGDMDGNPRVTPDVFEDALVAHRVRGLAKLVDDVRALAGALSASARHAKPPAELVDSIARDEARLPAIAKGLLPRTIGEPWRRKLSFVEARLVATLAKAQTSRVGRPMERALSGGDELPIESVAAYASAAELEEDLELVHSTLARAGGTRSGARRVRAILDVVRAQGLSIAELELRTRAEDVVDAAAFVTHGAALTEGGARIGETLRRLHAAQQAGGEQTCRTLILSMAKCANDVRCALVAARAAGLWDQKRSCATIDVVPLFETLEALDAAPLILAELFDDAVYRRHLDGRGLQEVMVGYSDSGKEVGLLAAAGALRRAQVAMPEVARRAGVKLRIFHGRGESVARGGGPAQGAILALPPGSVAGAYKATEQGEALDQKFGLPLIAERTVELVVGGALLHTLNAQPNPDSKMLARYAPAFDELAELGRRAYRALVWDEPQFERFFTTASPLEELGRMNIGSRPTKRAQGGLEALRAIPWVFAWTQTRAILPAWYGVGSALEQFATTPERAKLVAEMFASWPFFRAVVDNVEMVLAKTDVAIARRYAGLAPEDARDAVWPRIEAELARTKRWVKRLNGETKLLERNPTLRRSIALRNPYVDPMSLLQVELLRRRRAGDEASDRALLLTINGIAAGLRNTG